MKRVENDFGCWSTLKEEVENRLASSSSSASLPPSSILPGRSLAPPRFWVSRLESLKSRRRRRRRKRASLPLGTCCSTELLGTCRNEVSSSECESGNPRNAIEHSKNIARLMTHNNRTLGYKRQKIVEWPREMSRRQKVEKEE